MKNLITIFLLFISVISFGQGNGFRALSGKINIDVGKIDTLYFTNDTLYLSEDGILFKTYISASGGDGYVSSASFNTGNGIITLNDPVNGAKTVDIDGRYLQLTGGTLSGGLTVLNALTARSTSTAYMDLKVGLTTTQSIWQATSSTTLLESMSNQFKFKVNGGDAMILNTNQSVTLPDYGLGNNTGTIAYYLGVDASGNVLEGTPSGSGVNIGTHWQIPYVNSTNDDFDYSPGFTYSEGTFSSLQVSDATLAELILFHASSNWFSINSVSSGTASFAFSSQSVMTFTNDGKIQFNDYGLGNNTGTAAYNLEVTSSGDIIETTAGSDFRMKKNFRVLHNSLNKILSLNTYAFDWIPNEELPKKAQDIKFDIKVDQDYKKRESAGVIAQEIKNIIPEAVKQYNNGYYKVDYEVIVPHLIEAIKDQQKQIDELKQLIESK